MPKLLVIVFSAWALLAGMSHAQEADGLLADVYTTSGDNFTIELHSANAARTVANFMRLASGDQPWLDHASGTIVTGIPYYSGTVFKSEGTLPRKYLEAGERKDAIGTEGPGYVLRDEIIRNGNLSLSHIQYRVTMANTGPHSGGGKFIINLRAGGDTNFDYKNSAFGTVRQLFYTYNAQGQAIAVSNGYLALNNIFSSAGQVAISSIAFRRRGAQALAFDETAHIGELPSICKVPITSLTHTSTDAILHHPSQAGGYYRAYGSIDLSAWAYIPSFDTYHGLGVGASEQMPFAHSGLSSIFFRMLGILYPTTTAPQNLHGKRISMGLNQFGQNTSDIVFFDFSDDGAASTYLFPNGTNGVLSYTYTVTGPYSAELHIDTPGLTETTYTLYFGGSDYTQTTNQVMRAEIQYDGQAKFESHFEMGPDHL